MSEFVNSIKRSLPWRDFAGICPDCEPDEAGKFKFTACLNCLRGVIEVIDDDACPICQQIIMNGGCINRICADPNREFSRVIALGYRIRGNLLYKLTYNLKFNNRRGNRLPLAVLLAGFLRDRNAEMNEYDHIIPVPRTADKAERIGDPVVEIFNIARYMCENICPESLVAKMIDPDNIPLVKRIESTPSPDLGLMEKVADVELIRGGYKENPYTVKGKNIDFQETKVLLFDDIFTTGYHTLSLAALALLSAGAEQVDALVLARQKRSI